MSAHHGPRRVATKQRSPYRGRREARDDGSDAGLRPPSGDGVKPPEALANGILGAASGTALALTEGDIEMLFAPLDC